MNADNFYKWVTEKLLPNMEPGSVVVLDNASYHNVQIDKCPTSSTRKAEMQEWLTRHGIPFSANMLRTELLEICRKNKEGPTYKLDKLLSENGHIPVRLPPYHAELNPIELIWANLKKFVASNNFKQTMSGIQDLIATGLQRIDSTVWDGVCKHVETVEARFYASDIAVDEEIDRVVITIGDDDSDYTDSDVGDDDNDDDSDYDEADGDSDDDFADFLNDYVTDTADEQS